MNPNNADIPLKLSRLKAILIIIFPTIILCGAGYYFVKAIQLDRQFDKYFLIICTSALILTMSFAIKNGIKTIININAGIVLTKDGIKVNWGLNSGQLILWQDISGIRTRNAFNEPPQILIFVKKPDKYVTEKIGFVRFLQQLNLKAQKTPLVLTTHWYEMNSDQIFILLEDKINTVHNNDLS